AHQAREQRRHGRTSARPRFLRPEARLRRNRVDEAIVELTLDTLDDVHVTVLLRSACGVTFAAPPRRNTTSRRIQNIGLWSLDRASGGSLCTSTDCLGSHS